MHKIIKIIIFIFLLYCNVFSEENKTLLIEYILITNKESQLESINRLDAYKLFNNSNNNSYKLVCFYIKDSEKNTDSYKKLEMFIQSILDDNDITLVKYKSLSLDKIRKRDTVKITTFKTTAEEIIKEVASNKNIIGVIPASELTPEVTKCLIK